MPRTLVLDTSVVAHLTKAGKSTAFYRGLIADLAIAFSFQTLAELLAAEYPVPRHMRMTQLISVSMRVPHSDAASFWYASCVKARNRLRAARRAGSDAGDADVWIIATAMELRAPLVSHDKQQIELARAMGVPTYTAIPTLRAGNPE